MYKILRTLISTRTILLNRTISYVRCQSCGSKSDGESVAILCSKCGSLYPIPESIDYFKLFGYHNPEFSLDLKTLSQRYKSLQRQLHPDKFVLKSQDQKDLSELWSPLINKVYNSLKKPLPRALHILAISGHVFEESRIHLDPLFLSEIMEKNEELENFQTLEELKVFSLDNETEIQRLLSEIESNLKLQNFDLGMVLVAKLKYFTSLQDKISLIEEKFN